jgi:hypothetical protein
MDKPIMLKETLPFPLYNGKFSITTCNTKQRLITVKDTVLATLKSKGLYEQYGEITEAFSPSSLEDELISNFKALLSKELKPLFNSWLNTDNDTDYESTIHWVLMGFPCTYR